MRNLKRALSLTLASVMLLGMMVVGAGAAGYPDVDSNDNAEAIEVLQAVKVMVGDDNGNFGPDDQVNRAQMAVVMALLLDLNYDYYEGADPGFWDVPSWAAPYVAACYANGIVSGYGNGQYGSADSVTAVQAASMMMRALGYFKYQSDYKEGFELSTVSQASKIRLFDGIAAKSNEPLTRNDVAQLALNTLKTPIVEPDDNTISITDANGNVVATGGQVNYVVTASSQPFARAIGKDEVVGTGLNQVQGYVIELGEQLYNGKLELRDNTRDDFGRPSRTWVYNGTEIGSYAKKELLVPGGSYTVAVKGKTIYELLGQSAIRDNELYTYLDGANNSITKNQLARSYDSDLAGTGRGVLTEVYLDTDHDELTIVSINTWLAQASVDYNSNSESITLTIYDNGNGSSLSKRVDVEDAPFIANMKKDDWCLVQWADESSAHSQKTVVDAFDVEIREDQKVTSFKRAKEDSTNLNENDGKRVEEIITGGETIKNNAQAWYKNNTLNDFNASALVNKTYTVFMDQYDNFIGVELYSGKDQYVFITGYDRNGSNISVNTAKASAIFTDGTMQAISVDVKATNDNITAWLDNHTANQEYKTWRSSGSGAGSSDGENRENMWYQYTEDRGVYTLTPVDGYTKDVNGITETNNSGNVVGVERNVNSSKVYLSPNAYTGSFGTGNSYGEDASIYITVDDGSVDTSITDKNDVITDVTGVYTGAQNVNLVVPSGKWIHAVWKDNYIVAAIVYGDAEGTVENYAYIRGGINREWVEEDGNGNRTHYWEFDAVMNGEKVTKTIKSKFSSTVNELNPGQVQELILDNDGYVTKIKDVAYPSNTSVREDKLYNNVDFQANETNGKDSVKGNNVYHVETRTNAARQNNVVMPNLDSNGYTLLAFQGNTLRYGATNKDLGLTVNRNAKAVVKQYINNDWVWTEYDSVNSAYSILNDADRDSSTNQSGAKQFNGEVIAVLDSNGVAAWVVFIDNTPTSTTDDNYNNSASNTIGNITVNVQSSNAGIANRNIYAAQDANGYLTVQIPVASNVIGASASRITVTENGVYRFDQANVAADRIIGQRAEFNINQNFSRNNEIVVTIYNFNASTGSTPVRNVNVTLATPTAGNALPQAVASTGVIAVTTWAPNDATAVAGRTYTATITLSAASGYTLAEGWTLNYNGASETAATTITKTFTVPANPGEKEYLNIFGTWFEVIRDEDGNIVDMVELPGKPEGALAASMFSVLRSAVIPGEIEKLDDGGKYEIKLGDFIFEMTYLNKKIKVSFLRIDGDVSNPTLGEGEKLPDGSIVYTASAENSEEVPATTKQPTFTAGKDGKANKVDLDLGEPMPGGKLPKEILIDDALTAEIVWEGDTNGNGIADEDEDLKYTYKVVKAADGADVTGDTHITVGETTYSVPAETMNSNSGVSVENGEVKGDGVVEVGKMFTVTVNTDENATATGAGEFVEGKTTTVTVTAKEGYILAEVKVDGKAVTLEKGATTWTKTFSAAATVDVTTAVDEFVGLPFTLAASTKDVKYGSVTRKVADLQSDVKIDMSEATAEGGTIKVTGKVNYTGKWTGFGADERMYFLDLTLNQTDTTKYESIAFKSLVADDYRTATSTKDDVYVDGSGSGSGTKTLTNNLTIAFKGDETSSGMNVYLRAKDVFGNNVGWIIDCSGVELIKPVPLEVMESSVGRDEKIANFLKDLTPANVQGEDFKAELKGSEIVLTGSLKLITVPTEAGYGDKSTGYFCVFDIKKPGLGWTVTSSNGYSGTTDTDKELLGEAKDKDTLFLKVGDTGTEKKVITVTVKENGTTRAVYTVNTEGLSLEKPGTGDVTLKPMTTKLPDNFGGLKASEFQEDLKVELKNGTVYVSGNLTPVKMNAGWGDNNTGYFVWFDIDASGVAGAKSLIIRGTKGQYASKNHEDFIYQLGDENLKKDDLTSKTTTLYVLNQAGSADTAPVENAIVKEYPVDFSGVTLKQSVPFTVSHELSDANDAEAVHQSLLCNGTNYKVTVDHKTKEIIVTGDVYMISEGNAPYAWSIVTGDKLGFKQTESGYFVTFEMKPSSVGGFTKYNQAGYSKEYKENDTQCSGGVVTQVIRVAPMNGENPYGAVKVYVGNEDTVGIEYTLNLKGVNWVSDYKETTTAPSGT